MEISNVKELIETFVKGKYGAREIFLDRSRLEECLKFSNGKIIKNDIDVGYLNKQIYPDMIILQKTYSFAEILHIYVKVGTRSWIPFNGDIMFDGLNNLIDYIDFNILNNLKMEQNAPTLKLKEVRFYAISVSTGLEKRNLKLNEYFLNNEKFLELKENNFFGVSKITATAFGPLMWEHKLCCYCDYTFSKKDIFDPCFSQKFGKNELSYEMDEMLKEFYISEIYYLDTDANGDVVTKIIKNENIPMKTIDILIHELISKINENKYKIYIGKN